MDRRQFAVTAAATALVLPGAAATRRAAALPAADAVRLDAGRVRIDWTGVAGPVRIASAAMPDARGRDLRELAGAATGGSAVVAAPVTPRPYFVLQGRGGAPVRVAERLLPLQGGRNFRDLGGYRGAGGRAVAWGRVYRSGVMSGLTDTDRAYLSSLGIGVICDLRSAGERSREPGAFAGSDAIRTISGSYELDSSLAALVAARDREQAVRVFAGAYGEFARTLTPQLTEMFASLLEGRRPLAVNCTAGKDRTGLAAALILSALGVPRETVIADYALSQIFVPVETYLDQGAGSPQMAALSRLPRPVANVILGSDPDVMRLTLAQMDREAGGPAGFVRDRLGVGAAGLRRLQGLYLT